MDYERIKRRIKDHLSLKRYKHSLGVVDCAIPLAKMYNCDVDKTKIAAISHDCAKELKHSELVRIAKSEGINVDPVTLAEPQLLHGPVGRYIANREFNITDEEILNAIEYHTTGRAHMTTLEKIIYLSDIMEIGRSYLGVEEVRELAKINLDDAILLAMDNTIKYVVSINSLLHPRTIEARNSILLKK